jgi:hypothetical protein
MSWPAECGLCGHVSVDHPAERQFASGFLGGSVWIEGQSVNLCHTDNHSCYHRWTVYGERPDDWSGSSPDAASSSKADNVPPNDHPPTLENGMAWVLGEL